MAQTQSDARPKKRRLGLRGKLIALAALLAAVVGAFFFGTVWGRRETPPEITADLIGQQLHDIQELAVVEYYYTNMGRFENQLDFYGWQVPFTTKRFIVSYDGVIRAGVDLSELSVMVSGSTISITLPPAKILSHEIPEESIEVFDETKNIFNPITIEDYTGFTADQQGQIEQKAVENGLLDRAQQKSQEAVENLLAFIPGMEDYTLVIRSSV